MFCFHCGRYPIEHHLSMVPIDPRGTPNRRWECTECKENRLTVKTERQLREEADGK